MYHPAVKKKFKTNIDGTLESDTQSAFAENKFYKTSDHLLHKGKSLKEKQKYNLKAIMRRDHKPHRESLPVCLHLYSQEGMRRLHNSTASINNDYLFTTGRLHKKQQDSTKVDLSTGLGNDFNFGDQPVRLSSHKSFPTFWQAKWLKRNVSMLSTGKQKFVLNCRIGK